jgi:hypothetical protein
MVFESVATPDFDRRTFIGTGMMAGAGLALGGMPVGAIAQDRRLTTVGGTAKTQAAACAASQGRRPTVLVLCRTARRRAGRTDSCRRKSPRRGPA